MVTEWMLGAIIGVLTIIIGTLFKLHLSNRARLTNHDILFASFADVRHSLDELKKTFKDTLEKHEDKEDKQFDEIHKKLERLTVNVALLKKSSNGD